MLRRLGSGVSGFRYLVSDAVALDNRDEAEALRNTLDAMTIVGLSQAEQVSAPPFAFSTDRSHSCAAPTRF